MAKRASKIINLAVAALAAEIKAGKRQALARAITLVESNRADHQEDAQRLLLQLMPGEEGAVRVGITGVPGVGKSTFIEALGSRLTAEGHRVAVLAIDPTSSRSGGSILGDKTRMQKLANNPDAFVRPSPTGGKLGGVTAKTREAMVLCEAAGYDVILVETVGTGQSEILVADMVDFFLLLMLPGAGDELQGIKKGVLELAHMIVINKAEEENARAVTQAVRELRGALRILHPADAAWKPPVLTSSALHDQGLAEIWREIGKFVEASKASGDWAKRRREQTVRWMWDQVEESVLRSFRGDVQVAALISEVEAGLLEGQLTPTLGAEQLLKAFRRGEK
ncbi:MAG: methylmalonyl Co-A mutase-associated GTPase MeaB [Sphingomonadales bacterium]